VTRILTQQPGIVDVQADFHTHRVAAVVNPDQVDMPAAFGALMAAGYPGERIHT
jgi:hypothetical protein